MTSEDYKEYPCDNIEKVNTTFSEYGGFILQVIRSQVNNEELAEDLFQDFFLSLICRPIPDNIENMKSYLYRAVTNDIIDFRRKNKNNQECLSFSENYPDNVIDEAPYKQLVIVEEVQKMLQLIKKKLPHSQAFAITSRYKNDDSIGEIARKMNVAKQSVSSYISSGIQTIREYTIEHGEYGYDRT